MKKYTMVGQVISHYKILEKLGEGGMGIVHKAHDTKLDRVVALKFLPPYLSSDSNEKERFYLEARAASALMNPNVAVIFEVNEFEGRVFLAMEYVEGQTLKKLVEQGDPLSVKKALDIAIQACDGLAAAHEKGIVHRDIKSDNIMVTPKGQVKVMDFGLAKLKGATKLTKAGSTLGTAAYMSPEQAQGDDVDHRSDIFSFGVVLYELLTGRLPFRGEHHSALMYSLINEDPQPIARFNDKVSPDLERMVMKALAKDKDDRYQHADDLLADLRRERKQLEYAKAGYTTTRSVEAAAPAAQPKHGLKKYVALAGTMVVAIALAAIFFYVRRDSTETPAKEPSRKMLAVLPFENLGAPEQEYFADGITEEVTSRLSGLSGLGVIARTSAMQYKKTTKTLQQIGAELGVAYVLQGTIRWSSAPQGGVRVRVSPALIKVSDATQLWAQPYDAVFSDVFKIQSEIASQVASALGITLLQPERKSLEASHTDNSEAYDAYLRGNDYFRRSYREPDIQIALQMFEKAVELDPKFALAYARLSEAHSSMYWFHFDHTKERLDRAKQAVDEALKLNPELPDAHSSLGYYYYWGYLDYENALKEFALAQQSRPNDSRLFLAIGAVQRRQGNMELAATTMTKGSEIDPRSSELAFNTAQTYLLLRDYPQAERFVDRAISLAPDLPDRYALKARLYLAWNGDSKKARSVLQQAANIAGAKDDENIFLRQLEIEVVDGRYQEALGLISSGTPKPFDNQYQFTPRAQFLAEVYGLMKQRVLERSYYDSARIIVQSKLREQPDDARFHSALGIAYAGLGRREEAIREGKRAVELMPISREAWRGSYRVRDLARIYAMVGEYPAAIDQLEILISKPSELSAQSIRIEPTWAALHGNVRFEKLIGKNE